MKRRLRLLSWQLRGAKKAPEIDAGDIAVVHPDSLAARKAFEERMGRERAAALVGTLPPGASPELAEGGEIVFLDEPDLPDTQIDPLDVKALRSAPDGTVVDAGGQWTKFGTLWFPGKWPSITDATLPGEAALNSARLAHLAANPPTEVSDPAGIVPEVEADPVHADPLMERLATVERDLGRLPEPRPDDAPWVGPDGGR